MRLPSSYDKNRRKRLRRVLRQYKKKAVSIVSSFIELPSLVRDSLNFDFNFEIEDSDLL